MEEMRLLGSRLRSKSSEDRRSVAVKALEAGLEAKRQEAFKEITARANNEAPVTSPETETDLQSKLSDALERVTVRSVVGLRGIAEVPRPIEAVVVAVLQLVSCEYSGLDLHPSPPTTWEEARRILLKPGHFVSALRKFPFALQRGQIPDCDIEQAQQTWENLPRSGAGLSQVHEAARDLQPRPAIEPLFFRARTVRRSKQDAP